jgi:acetyltransferase-like isoleucine patch superfamily enzyme
MALLPDTEVSSSQLWSEVESFRHPDHREYMVGRARAEVSARLARLRGVEVEFGSKVRFIDGRALKFRGPGPFRFGDGCEFRSGPIRSRIATRPGGEIVFGERVSFNYGLNIHSSVSIEIGDHTLGGSQVTIYDTSFHPVDEIAPTKTAPVKIGRHVWLAHGCTILAGVTIGDHAVIGAGAVVARDVPPRTLMAGNPARPARQLMAGPEFARW